jgi:hypothetical protein
VTLPFRLVKLEKSKKSTAGNQSAMSFLDGEKGNGIPAFA